MRISAATRAGSSSWMKCFAVSRIMVRWLANVRSNRSLSAARKPPSFAPQTISAGRSAREVLLHLGHANTAKNGGPDDGATVDPDSGKVEDAIIAFALPDGD